MEIERHGQPVVHFDKLDLIKPRHVNRKLLLDRHKKRIADIEQSFPVFKSSSLKELERGNAVDALGFYQSGLVRPLIEVLGIIYRPYQFDFGLKYIKRSFPDLICSQIEAFVYVANVGDLQKKIADLERVFDEAIKKAKGT